MHRIETPDIIEVQKALQNIESSCQSYGARNLETEFLGNLWIPVFMFAEMAEKSSFLYDA